MQQLWQQLLFNKSVIKNYFLLWFFFQVIVNKGFMALSILFPLFRNPLKCHKCSKKWRNMKIVSRNSSFVHLKGIQIFITACKSYKKTHYYHQHNHKESTIRNQYHGKIQLYWSNIFCDTWKHFSNNILHKNSRVFVIVVVSLVCHVLLVSEFYYIPSSISWYYAADTIQNFSLRHLCKRQFYLLLS